jgi:23S rRNA (cytidine1920-2'-O)/16S rRNA (cytidine1409-2'-O)-methyltransferase
VDVGYGQLAWSLRNDPRVVCIERTNIRNITREQLDGEFAEMAVLDLSFISLGLVLPALRTVLTEGASVVCLVKPQFEAGRDKVGKGGVVRSCETHLEVLEAHTLAAERAGFGVKGVAFSPVKGPKGNVEFLSYLIAGSVVPDRSQIDLKAVVREAHEELI